MIVIFAGAGASKAVDRNKYPTTVEFFEKLPDRAKNKAFKEIHRFFIETADNDSGPVDIEKILWAYHELEQFMDTIESENTLISWALKSNTLARIVGKGANTDVIFGQIPTVRTSIRISRDIINEQVYSLYADIPDRASLSKTWFPLLSKLKKIDQLQIFTTNYDLIIETALEKHLATGFSEITGRTNGLRPHIDIDMWKKNDSDIPFFLTKLHGSVDWEIMNSNEIHIGTPRFTGNHEHHSIIYPGFKGQPDREPFITFHEHFRRCVKQASTLIFIGFAFRDEYINSILEECNPKADVIVVDPSATKITTPFDKKRTLPIPHGFNDKSVNICLKRVDQLHMGSL